MGGRILPLLLQHQPDQQVMTENWAGGLPLRFLCRRASFRFKIACVRLLLEYQGAQQIMQGALTFSPPDTEAMANMVVDLILEEILPEECLEGIDAEHRKLISEQAAARRLKSANST